MKDWWPRSAAARPPEPRGRPRPRGRRARPDHSLRLARADHLPGGRAPPTGGPRGAGHELAAGHRADGGQVLDLGAARAVRAADAGDHGLRDAGGGVRRVPRAGRRDREAAVRLDGPGNGAGERRGDGLPRLQDHRDRSAASTTCSGRSTTKAAISAPSWWAAACWRPSSGARTGWRTNLSRGGTAPADPAPRGLGRARACGRRRRWAPNTRAWTCCRRATARCTCSRSTGSRGGRACRRRRVWTWREQWWTISPVRARDHPGGGRRARGSSPACSKSARPSRATCRPGATFTTRATRISWRARSPSVPRSPPRATSRSAPRSAPPCRRPPAGCGRIPTWGSSCSWARSPGRRSAARGRCARRLRAVLAATTVADAAEVYAAIRQARPGGLGASASEDVATAPTVSLREAMALAADRDSVAREYATDFAGDVRGGIAGAPARPERRPRLGRCHRGVLPADSRGRAGHPHRAEAGTRRGGDRVAACARGRRGGRRSHRGRPAGAPGASTPSFAGRPMRAIPAPPRT